MSIILNNNKYLIALDQNIIRNDIKFIDALNLFNNEIYNNIELIISPQRELIAYNIKFSVIDINLIKKKDILEYFDFINLTFNKYNGIFQIIFKKNTSIKTILTILTIMLEEKFIDDKISNDNNILISTFLDIKQSYYSEKYGLYQLISI